MRPLILKSVLLPLLFAVSFPVGGASALRCIGCPVDGPPFSRGLPNATAERPAVPALLRPVSGSLVP